MAKDGEGEINGQENQCKIFRLANETPTLITTIKGRKERRWISHALCMTIYSKRPRRKRIIMLNDIKDGKHIMIIQI